MFVKRTKDAMALFGSTSPSYLILQSLDMANWYIAEGYREKLEQFLVKVEKVKEKLKREGFVFVGQEPLKLTLATKSYGYLGTEFSAELRRQGIETEFADPDYVVMMLSCEMGEMGLRKMADAICKVRRRMPVQEMPPEVELPKQVMSVRNAIFSPQEKVSAKDSEGRILASLNVGCPPAVPIAVCGERIDKKAIELFEYYGIDSCNVVK